jgi:peptidoglycan/xylan/chitin deacetylase (PgdA/CDA1 family)
MRIRTLVYRVGGSPFLQAIRGGESAGAVAIVMAHGVHEETIAARPAPPISSMTLTALKANVDGLKRTFHFVSMDEATEMISGAARWRQNCVALTFDDSLKCMADVVAPMLAERGIRATFYLSTEAIESGRPYWWLRFDYAMTLLENHNVSIDLPEGRPYVLTAARSIEALRRAKKLLRELDPSECERIVAQVEAQAGVTSADTVNAYPFARLMTWDDAKQLNILGMTLGSHSVTHANLTRLAVDEQRRELELSRCVIEKASGVECVHFCYPYGQFSEVTPSLVSSAGYRSAVSTAGPGWNRCGDDRFMLRRFSMPKESLKLAYILSGWASILSG